MGEGFKAKRFSDRFSGIAAYYLGDERPRLAFGRRRATSFRKTTVD
jgi:hypothetical protein